MTAVFATKIFAFDPENISQRVLLTRERLQAIDQMNGEGRQQSFAASLLLEYVLKRLFPKVEHPLEIAVAQGGKPYLANYPDIYFNLSHSGEWAVCAISESPVGVDIQHCDEGRRDVASRFFHREEIRYLDGLPQFRRDEGFYRLWTLKESFVKATGRGLDLPLRSFWVDIRRGRPQIDCGNIEGQYKLFELDFPADPEYRLAVCVRDLSEREPRLMVL